MSQEFPTLSLDIIQTPPLPPPLYGGRIINWLIAATHRKKKNLNPRNKSIQTKANIPPVISSAPFESSGSFPASGAGSSWSAIIATKQLFLAVRVTVVKPKHNH